MKNCFKNLLWNNRVSASKMASRNGNYFIGARNLAGTEEFLLHVIMM